jgi:hypothetical protein
MSSLLVLCSTTWTAPKLSRTIASIFPRASRSGLGAGSRVHQRAGELDLDADDLGDVVRAVVVPPFVVADEQGLGLRVLERVRLAGQGIERDREPLVCRQQPAEPPRLEALVQERAEPKRIRLAGRLVAEDVAELVVAKARPRCLDRLFVRTGSETFAGELAVAISWPVIVSASGSRPRPPPGRWPAQTGTRSSQRSASRGTADPARKFEREIAILLAVRFLLDRHDRPDGRDLHAIDHDRRDV